MGSVSRRLTKHLSFANKTMAARLASRRAGMSLAAAAAAVAPSMSEGVLLSRRLERAARQNNAADPLHFLEFLKRMRRGYDPDVDGPSLLMDLVDEIKKFEVEELARRAAAAEGAKG